MDAGLARRVAVVAQAPGTTPEALCDHRLGRLDEGERRDDGVSLLVARLARPPG